MLRCKAFKLQKFDKPSNAIQIDILDLLSIVYIKIKAWVIIIVFTHFTYTIGKKYQYHYYLQKYVYSIKLIFYSYFTTSERFYVAENFITYRYLEMLNQFESVSYGDELFGNFIVFPLQQCYPSNWRKLLLTEHPQILRFLRVPLSKVNVLKVFFNRLIKT